MANRPTVKPNIALYTNKNTDKISVIVSSCGFEKFKVPPESTKIVIKIAWTEVLVKKPAK
jgi:hypothetical protein